MRKLIIAANWKMNKGPADTAAFLETFLAKVDELSDKVDVVIAPNFLSIPTASALINDVNPSVGLSAQNLSENDNGAFTGETSTDMLKELYEPVWAIGTGVTASAEQAQDTHKYCRSVIEELYGAEAAAAVRIQYGGSVKGANSAELLGQPDIDGALVGGAALEADSFLELIANAVAE